MGRRGPGKEGGEGGREGGKDGGREGRADLVAMSVAHPSVSAARSTFWDGPGQVHLGFGDREGGREGEREGKVLTTPERRRKRREEGKEANGTFWTPEVETKSSG